MTKWPRRLDRFTVRIVYDKNGRAKITVPRPLISLFDKPDTVTFEIGSSTITAEFTRDAIVTK